MTHFIKPEYLVSLYLILNDKEEVTLRELGDYVGKLNEELRERKIEAVFLFSDKYVGEMLSVYKDYFAYNGIYEDGATHYCTYWVKRKVSNEVLSEKFTAYLSNDVLKVASDLNEKESIMSTEEKMEVMKAYTEGKSIQSKAVIGEHWCDDIKPTWDWNHFEYRIKPESKYRPYKDVNEMLDDINKCLETIQHPVLGGIWLNHTNRGLMIPINGIDKSDNKILLGDNWYRFNEAFLNYAYLNGKPFGIKE